MRVGFVGAGRMGTPMVQRLIAAGHRVQVLGRTDERCSQITELGAEPVADLTAVAASCEVVVVCVFSDDQVEDICLDGPLVRAMDAGSALVVHTTGSPRTVQSIADRWPAIGVVDAPVSGGPHDIAAGTVTLFVGGHDDVVARVRPLLGAYADPLLHAGATGAGQLVKLINNTLFAAQIGLVAEAARLGTQFGIDETALLDALTHGSAQSRVLTMIASAGSTHAFIDAVGEFIGKDIAVVRRTVEELGGDLGILESAVRAGTPCTG